MGRGLLWTWGQAFEISSMARLKEHMVAKGIISVEGWNAIDWEALEVANRGFPKLFQLWAAKHASGFCMVGKMMKRWGY